MRKFTPGWVQRYTLALAYFGESKEYMVKITLSSLTKTPLQTLERRGLIRVNWKTRPAIVHLTDAGIKYMEEVLL